MRVIAGTARGRRIRAPEGRRVRPTPARVREALFAILGDRVCRSRVLDLYCGSGALGIEALSRGASWVTFVDISRICLRIVRENLDTLGFSDQARLICRRCPEGVDISLAGPFDIVLSDPPYGEHPHPQLARKLLESGILATGAIWIYEGGTTGGSAFDPVAPPGWMEVDRRRYGDTGLWIYQPTG